MPKTKLPVPERYNLADILALKIEIERLQRSLAIAPSAFVGSILGGIPSKTNAGRKLIIESFIPVINMLMGCSSLAEIPSSEYQKRQQIMSILVNLAQILFTLLSGFLLHPRVLRFSPNSIYTTNQALPEGLKKYASMNYPTSTEIQNIRKELEEYRALLSARTRLPYQISGAVIVFFILFRILFPDELLEFIPETAIAVSSFVRNMLTHSACLTPIITATWWFFQTTYKDWGRDTLIRDTIEELDKIPNLQNCWKTVNSQSSVRAQVYTVTCPLKIELSLPNDVKIQMTRDEYLNELAKALVAQGFTQFVLSEDTLSMPIDGMHPRAVNDVYKQLIAQIKQENEVSTRIKPILRELNFLKDSYNIAETWQFVKESDKLKFYIQLSDNESRRDELIISLKSSYPLIEIITKVASPTLVLTNPEYIKFSGGSAVTYFEPAPQQLPSRKTEAKKDPLIPPISHNIYQAAPTILVHFPISRLSYNSATNHEQHLELGPTAIRRINADWLPPYSHFSYLAPTVLEFLSQDEINQILNILIAGNAFPSGTLKSKLGCTGIVRAKEAYRSTTTGQQCVSHYKLKTTHNLGIHGRLLENDDTNRRQLYIFDGAQSKDTVKL